MRSPWGRIVKAIREDEDAVRSLGKNVYSYKMQALITGGVFGCIAGFIFALSRQSVQPDNYSTNATFFAYTALFLGGAATIFGPVLGSMIFWAIIQFTDVLLSELSRRLRPRLPRQQPAWSGAAHARRRAVDGPHDLPAAGAHRRSARRWRSVPDAEWPSSPEPPGSVPPDSRAAPESEPPEPSEPETIEALEATDVVEARAGLVGSHERPLGPYGKAAQEALADVAGEPGVAKPDPILVAENVRRSFGGLVAVDVDHLEVQRGSITALIGPNGAGKTTLFNLLTGFDKPNSGRWRFSAVAKGDGAGSREHELAGVAAYKVARLGMVRTFQLTKSLSRLSVMENMKLGATGQTGENFFVSLVRPLWRSQEQSITARAETLLDRFRLTHMRDEYAGSLSGGQRKLLEMARALMVEPEVIMLDEPMAGVNPALTQSLLGHVKDLREDGMTVIFVEHDMDVVYDISDWVVVMAEGRVIAEGPPEAIGQNQEVIDAYLGAHHDAPLTEEDEARQLAEAEAAIATGRHE